MPNVTYTPDGALVATWDPSAGEAGVATYSTGDMAWILVAACLVMIMAPGVGFLYSGLLRRKNALSMLFLAMAVYSLITIEWFFWGYSLAFSETGSKFIGNLRHFGLMNVLDAPSQGSSKIPALLFAFYQSMFAALTPVIAIGGVAERARLLPVLVVSFLWATIVYNPVACWTWNPTGWGYINGVLDFAGGGPVHITSGTASLIWSLYLGRRRGYGTAKLAYRPHSVSHVILGTTLIWFGWFGFNGGSEVAMNLRSIQASIVTNIAAAMGGLTWMIMDFIYTRKWSAVSLCSGILAGLVGITPAAGFVGSPAALAIGAVAAIAANFATGLKVLLKIDDAVDGFALHAVGGYVGSVLTGLFADARVVDFDGYTVIPGGWINHHYVQLGWQLASATSILAYTAVVTYILIFIVDHIPGLKVRCSEDDEIIGMDESQTGEHGYDYVSIRRDLEDGPLYSEKDLSRTPSQYSSEKTAHHHAPTDAVTETSAREGAAAPAPATTENAAV
ncbi:ammonium transmembrane transporter [Rhodotorula toruloides]|uniref:Ammonium transporter n=1 Tax=Rhodotorula toruloides TaxID=5286 RepID=A0A511KR89_RHOTO|nr:ammonium transmembrane transporter [Rhodotorula toruloides]